MTQRTLSFGKATRRSFRPRSALLTLYGDYLLNRHEEVGIGSLIGLFKNLGLSEPSVRSAVSRMCRGGLLKVRTRGHKNYYSLTPKGQVLLTKGAQRIFVRRNAGWDGTWNIVMYSVPERKRKTRDMLRQELIWMGYGAAGGATMISPYDLTEEVMELAERLGASRYIQVFQAVQKGLRDGRNVVSTCWNLDRIHERYDSFIAKYQPRYEGWISRLKSGEDVDPSEYFVESFTLIHEYRKLPFYDPDLPEELLPEGWLRPRAAALFKDFHDLLTEKATEYFNLVIAAY